MSWLNLAASALGGGGKSSPSGPDMLSSGGTNEIYVGGLNVPEYRAESAHVATLAVVGVVAVVFVLAVAKK